MLDKLLGRKEKGINIFNLPERKYCREQRKLSKMDKKDLLDVMKDMEKHIEVLVEKVNHVLDFVVRKWKKGILVSY
jgi:hypothetical protein